VLVITNRHPLALRPAEIVENIAVSRLRFTSPRASLGPALRFPFAYASTLRAMLQQTPRPDIIHVQCASVQLAAAAGFARLRRVPLVLTTQGEVEADANNLFQTSSYARMMFRVTARGAAALTAPSHWTATTVAELAPMFREATVIPNGIDPRQWSLTFPPDADVVAAWGRHVPQKGFDLLLNAWPLVRKAIPTARLLIGGSGPETEALREVAVVGVEFLGPLDRMGVGQLLKRSRVVAIPSRFESFGIVALEAMAAGRAVVWSNRGGMREATGGLGWPVDPDDRESLAAALVSALHAQPDPRRYRRRAEEFSWAAIADRYLDIYRRIQVTPPHRRPK
jgi:glycogen(starch) synthase